jgi:catechol 2,3-dioxygenase-like lactoylglutathione lyase family enzyme
VSDFTSIILYVSDPLTSIRFYARLLGRQPLQATANFAKIVLAPGIVLGLWRRSDVQPSTESAPGCGELCCIVADHAAVLTAVAAWRDQGLTPLQEPIEKEFGFTAAGSDPDGHRLRVLCPAVRPV